MINWGLAQGGGFQNALAMGMQMGAQAREAKERKEYRNALAQYDPNNPETIKPIMEVDPRTGLHLQQQAQRAQAQQTEQRRADLPMMTRLLEHAAQGPEQWQQARGLAQQYGIDVSGLPEQFDPEWAQSQAQTMKLLATPEGQEALSTAGKQAVDMGFQPGTPDFQAKVTEIWQQNGAIPYTDSEGATRLYIPGRNGVRTSQQITEGTVIENDAGERMVFRGGKWEAMTGGGAGNSAGGF